jgi:hypothetical protein
MEKKSRIPPKVLSCDELEKKIGTRAELLQRIEGRATVRDSAGNLQLLISMRADKQFWIEIRSPWAGAFATLRADKDWVEFIIPRRKEHYRIPATEFWRSSQRRDKFLQILPIKIRPELIFSTLMGRLEPSHIRACKWNEKTFSYQLNLNENLKSSLFYTVHVDPIGFFPVQTAQIPHQDFIKLSSNSAIQEVDNLEFALDFEVYRQGRLEWGLEWTALGWMAQLGAPPPLFPVNKTIKRIDY